MVLRYVSELRCEPDLFDSRTDREGWYDDFSLGDESGGSTVVVDGDSYSDSHRFISGSHSFVSGIPNIPCNRLFGCTVQSMPHQHPRDYEGPTPWVRRLETALIHMSDVNTVDPATYGLVRRVARIEPLGSPQSSSSEPFPIDAPIGMDEPATGSRAYPPPFYGIPSRSTIEPSAASGGQSGYALVPVQLLLAFACSALVTPRSPPWVNVDVVCRWCRGLWFKPFGRGGFGPDSSSAFARFAQRVGGHVAVDYLVELVRVDGFRPLADARGRL